jgi:hypothetical protein
VGRGLIGCAGCIGKAGGIEDVAVRVDAFIHDGLP